MTKIGQINDRYLLILYLILIKSTRIIGVVETKRFILAVLFILKYK